MASSHPSSSAEKAQYHHFIPRFILRNFSHTYRPAKKKGNLKRHSHGEDSRRTNLYAGDKALNIIDLSKDPPELAESPVRRTFGLVDMYRDFKKASNQQYLEKELGTLEFRAASILSRICKAFDIDNQDVWMSRTERNVLRTFFFMMKYRGRSLHKRFLGDDTKGYVEDDKEKFLKYMRGKGFQTPLDVWFHKIKVILELKMDLQGEWMKDLVDRIYPDDAIGFIIHSEMMYLAFCTPSDPNTEFILTENCYSVFEGPVSIFIDPMTGERREGLWTSYHEFGPLSPKLIMVLRSAFLPNSEEDKNENISRWRETMHNLIANQHGGPSAVKSIRADLPVKKARNSYSTVGNTGVELQEGEDGLRRSYHRFCFRFFKISTEYVNKVNTIMLENAHEHQTIAFASRTALKRTIEHYLSLPPDQGFKIVYDEGNDLRLTYLLKLEEVLKQLGSDKRLVYQRQRIPPNQEQTLEIMGQELLKYLPEQPTEFMQLQLKLGEIPLYDGRAQIVDVRSTGGTRAGIFKDFDQARIMLNLRIKIDVWSKRVDERIRQQARDNLIDLYCELPPQRIWLYLKHIRHMLLRPRRDHPSPPMSNPPGITNGIQQDDAEEFVEGPEDVIAKGICSSSTSVV
jgi:hypothetical protein